MKGRLVGQAIRLTRGFCQGYGRRIACPTLTHGRVTGRLYAAKQLFSAKRPPP